MPYVSDREAWTMARVLESHGYPRVALRIRRAVWVRRIIAVLSIALMSTGFWLILYGLALYTVRY